MREDNDSPGSVSIPDGAVYSANTVRGAENFHLMGGPIRHYPNSVVAMAKVKKAAARVMTEMAKDESQGTSHGGDFP